MKKILICLLFSGFNIAFAQTVQEEIKHSPKTDSAENTDVNQYTPVEYPGGIPALRGDISRLFNSSKFEWSSGVSKSITEFDVNPDGSISSISTTGNNPRLNKEMDRVVKALKTKWKPATKNGQPVKTTYKIPMTLNNL